MRRLEAFLFLFCLPVANAVANIWRPSRKPTVAPSTSPLPTSTYKPTIAPTNSREPTIKPTDKPSIPGLAVSNPYGGRRTVAITTPACFAFVGIILGLAVFWRDEKRAKSWKKVQEEHQTRVVTVREALQADGRTDAEIESILAQEEPPPDEPEYPNLLADIWFIVLTASTVPSIVSNRLWLIFCNVKLVRNPASARLIGEVLRSQGSFQSETASISPLRDADASARDTASSHIAAASPIFPLKRMPKKARESLESTRRRSRRTSELVTLPDSPHVHPAESAPIVGRPNRTVRGRWSDIGPQSPQGLESPQNSLGQHLIDGFPPDCGPDENNLTLSYTKALVERLKHVPHMRYGLLRGQWDSSLDQPVGFSNTSLLEDGEYVSDFPLTVNLGQHSVGKTPCEMLCPSTQEPIDGVFRAKYCSLARCRDEADPLLTYPIGVRLYLKMLKATYRAFFWFSFASLFMMGTFWFGSTWDSSQRRALMYDSEVDPANRLKNSLFFLSLGSYGARKHECRSASEGESLYLTCPYGRISSINAYYGDPIGSCNCPVAQQVDSDGECPDDQIFRVENGQSLFDGCESVGQGPGFCIRTSTQFGETCCASDFVNDRPESPRENPTCRSDTAQYILRALCLGNKDCKVVVGANSTIDYSPRLVDGEILPCSSRDLNFSSSHQCRESFAEFGNWSSCPAQEDFRLSVTAECSNDFVIYPLRSFFGLGVFFPTDPTLRKEYLTTCVTIVDAVVMLMVLVLLWWIQGKEEEAVVQTNRGTCTGGDYTALLVSLPTHENMAILKRELAKFLEKTLSKAKPVTRVGPIEVCDINFGLNNGMQLNAFRKRGLVARKLDLLEEKIALMNKQNGVVDRCFHHQRMAVLDEEVRILRAQFMAVCQEARNRKELIAAKCAFVTFLDQEGKERCLATFPPATFVSLVRDFLCKPKAPRFFGSGNSRHGFKLAFVQAPEPSDIIWENLTTPNWLRFLKKIATNILVFSMMLLSFAFIFSLTAASRNATASGDDIELISCDDFVYIFNETGFDVEILGEGGDGAQMVSKDDALRDNLPSLFNLTYGNTGLLQCYCDAIAAAPSKGTLKREHVSMVNPLTGKKEQYCEAVPMEVPGALILGFASVAITVINASLKYAYSALIDFEGPASRTEKVLSLTRKLAFAMFVNTGCLTLLINGNPSWFTGGASHVENLLSSVEVFVGPEDDFSVAWYRSVGTSLVLTMLANLVAMNAYKYIDWAQVALARCLDRATCTLHTGPSCSRREITSKVTQIQLEMLHAGPLFVIYDRYASFINTFYVCIVYSAGMPILLPVLFITLLVTFFVDKHTLLRVYRLPSALDHTIAIGTTKYLKYAVFIHFAIAAWQYSNPDMFTNGNDMIRTAAYGLQNVTSDSFAEVDAWNCTECRNSSLVSAIKTVLHSNETVSYSQVSGVAGNYIEEFVETSGLLSSITFSRLYMNWLNVQPYFVAVIFVTFTWLLVILWPMLTSAMPCLSILFGNAKQSGWKVAIDVEHNPGDINTTDQTRDICGRRVCRMQWLDFLLEMLGVTSSVDSNDDQWCEIDESECPHSKLRHHPVYGHSGETVGEGNPDYFHAISQLELEAAVSARTVSGQLLRAFKDELAWRRRHPHRARAKRQLIGLCSYDYHLNSEYQRLYALDSKSYHRFRAGKLLVADADFYLRKRSFMGRFLGSCLSFGHREKDPSAIFPDPPPCDEGSDMVVVGFHPKSASGPRVVVNVPVPDTAIRSMKHENSSRGSDGFNEGNAFELRPHVEMNIPGFGVVHVELPSGLEQLGLPEVQFEIPCVEIKPAPDRSGARCCMPKAKCFGSSKRHTSRWIHELEAVDSAEYDNMRVSAFEESVLERRRLNCADRSIVSPLKPFQDFARSSLDDDIDEEMRRIELGAPQMQRFVVKAPKEVVLQNMIPVVVNPAQTTLYCLWPNNSKEHSMMQFHLPTIESHQLEGENSFVNPAASDYDANWSSTQHQESLYSPGWCSLRIPQDDMVDLPAVIDDQPQTGLWSAAMGFLSSATSQKQDPANHPSLLSSSNESSTAEAQDVANEKAKPLTLYQVMAYAPKPVVKDFRKLSQFQFKLPGDDAALLGLLPGENQNKRHIRVRVPTCRNLPLHRQQTRVPVPGVGSRVPVEILASDLVLQPGLHGRIVQTHGYLPWSAWWDEDPMATQQAVPRVDEIFFDFPCVELPVVSPTGESTELQPKGVASNQFYHHLALQQESVFDDPVNPDLDKCIEAFLLSESKGNGANVELLTQLCESDISGKRQRCRAAAAEWAFNQSPRLFHEGSPIDYQRFQIVANETIAAEASVGHFSSVEIPHLGSATALFPVGSRAVDTRLLFELPTLNEITVADKDETESTNARVAKLEESRYRKKNDSTVQTKAGASFDRQQESNLGSALNRLQEGQDDSGTPSNTAASCGGCCSSSDRKSCNRSSGGSSNDAIEHAPQQIGWVVLPLSLDAVSPQTFLMLPAMVEFSQVLRALKRAHGLMDESDEVPANEPYREPSSFPSTPFRYQSNFERRLGRKSRRPSRTNDSPETVTNTSSSDSDSEIQVEEFAETAPPLPSPALLTSPQDHECPVLEGLSWRERDTINSSVDALPKPISSQEHSPSVKPRVANESTVCTLTRGLPFGLTLSKSPAGSFLVLSVAEKSTAELAGLLPGDLILAINGCPSDALVADLSSADNVIEALTELFTGVRTEKIDVPPKIKPGAVMRVEVPPTKAAVERLAMGAQSTTAAKPTAKKTASESVKVRVPIGAKPGDTIQYQVDKSKDTDGRNLVFLIERSPSRCPCPAADSSLESAVVAAHESQNPLLADSFAPNVPPSSLSSPSASTSASLLARATTTESVAPPLVPKKPTLDVVKVQLFSSHGTAKVGLRLCDRNSSKHGGPRCLHVIAVRSGGLAHRAGLRPRDQLVEVNGVKCAQWLSTKAAKVLCRALSATATNRRGSVGSNMEGSDRRDAQRGVTAHLTVHREPGNGSELSSAGDNEWLDKVHRQWPPADDSTSRSNHDDFAPFSAEPKFVTPRGPSRSVPLSSADSLSSTSSSSSSSTTSSRSSSSSESSSECSPSLVTLSQNRAHSSVGCSANSLINNILPKLKAGWPLCPADGGDAHILRFVDESNENDEADADVSPSHRKRGGYIIWRAEEVVFTEAVSSGKKWQQRFQEWRRKKRSATPSSSGGAQFFCADMLESATADSHRDNHLGQRVVNGRRVTLVFAGPPSIDLASARRIADTDSDAAQQVVASMLAFKARRELSEQQLQETSSTSPKAAASASTKVVTLPRYGPWMRAAYQRGRYELKVVCRSVEESDQLVRGLSAFAAQTLPGTTLPAKEAAVEASPIRLPPGPVSNRGDDSVAARTLHGSHEEEDAQRLTRESASAAVVAPSNQRYFDADILSKDRTQGDSPEKSTAVSGEVAEVLRDAAQAATEAAALSAKFEAAIKGHQQHLPNSEHESSALTDDKLSPTSRAAELTKLFEILFNSGADNCGDESLGCNSSQSNEADVSISLNNHFDATTDPSADIENNGASQRLLNGSPHLPNTTPKSHTRVVDASLDRPAPKSTPFAPSADACRSPLQETTSKVVNKGAPKKRAPEAKESGTITPTKKSPAKGAPRGTPRDMSPMRARAMRTKTTAVPQKTKASPPRWR